MRRQMPITPLGPDFPPGCLGVASNRVCWRIGRCWRNVWRRWRARYPDDIPRPGYWSGYRVLPELFEFWQDMPYRLHDRTVYCRSAAGSWEQTKLFP